MKLPGTCAAAIVLILLSMLASACDRDRGAAPPLPSGNDPAHTGADKPRPTTQELLNGARREIRLGVVPLTVRAPESWEVKTYGDGDITSLEGWAPHDEIKIQLARQPPIDAEKIALTESAARKEMAEKPDVFKVVNVREMGDVKILEQQSVGRTNDLPVVDVKGNQVVDKNGQPVTIRQVDYRWKISVYVPAGKAYDVYELIFLTLTQEEMDADKNFLREIVDSIRYDEKARDVSVLEAPKPRDADRPVQ